MIVGSRRRNRGFGGVVTVLSTSHQARWSRNGTRKNQLPSSGKYFPSLFTLFFYFALLFLLEFESSLRFTRKYCSQRVRDTVEVWLHKLKKSGVSERKY